MDQESWQSLAVLKKNRSWTGVKAVKTFDSELLELGIKRTQYRTRFNSKHTMNKWEFIVEEQLEGSGWKITKRKCEG